MIYSESELLMPSINVSEFKYEDVLETIKKQGYFEIRNPTVIRADNTLTELEGNFYVRKLGD